MSYSAIKMLFDKLQWSICRHCGKLVHCSCGCCHTLECNEKEMERFTASLKEYFDYEKEKK